MPHVVKNAVIWKNQQGFLFISYSKTFYIYLTWIYYLCGDISEEWVTNALHVPDTTSAEVYGSYPGDDEISVETPFVNDFNKDLDCWYKFGFFCKYVHVCKKIKKQNYWSKAQVRKTRYLLSIYLYMFWFTYINIILRICITKGIEQSISKSC